MVAAPNSRSILGIDPIEVAIEILARIDAATVSDSGDFIDTRGARCAW